MFIIFLVLALTMACSQTFDVSEASLTSMSLNDGGDSTESQYTGNGYVYFVNSNDIAVWKINSSEAGQTAISFRYLLPHSHLHAIKVYVNGNIFNSAFELHYFGTYQWQQSENLEVTLVAGINEIKL